MENNIIAQNNQGVALKLNEAVGSVLNQTNLIGFERAYATAKSIEDLKGLLTDEYMRPILQLQGNKLGFKTDKDKTGGYPLEVVKNCLIEAVLMGAQPYGNQFNIIAGNCYLTKEGTGYLLNKFPGLSYELVCGVPRVAVDAKSAVVEVAIKWTLNGETKEKTIPISIKNDAYTSVDALTGKATRKGRAWLLGTITGIEVMDGDVQEISHEVVSSSINPTKIGNDKERRRIIERIEEVTMVSELKKVRPAIKDDDSELLVLYNTKLYSTLADYIPKAPNLDALKKCEAEINPEDHDLLIALDDRKRELTAK